MNQDGNSSDKRRQSAAKIKKFNETGGTRAAKSRSKYVDLQEIIKIQEEYRRETQRAMERKRREKEKEKENEKMLQQKKEELDQALIDYKLFLSQSGNSPVRGRSRRQSAS